MPMTDLAQLGPQWIVRDEDISRIADAYGLAIVPGSAHPLGGAVNGVVRVVSDAGDVVLRVHRPWTTVERLEAVQQVQSHLRVTGLPIPLILANRDGRTWMWLHDRLVEVSTFVAGGHEADSWDEFSVSFAMLGRLHAALASIDPAQVPVPAHASFADPHTALAMLTETDSAFRSCAGGEGYDEAANIREQARRLWGRLDQNRKGYAERLPWSLIHGDFVGTNVLLANDRVIALVDFDRLAHRERIHELAVTLYCVLGRLHRAQPPDRPPTDDELARLAGLVEKYETTAHQSLSAVELAALPFEMARVPIYPIAYAGYLAAAGERLEAIADTRMGGVHLPRACWLVDNADRVHAALAHHADRPERSP
jgi:Ser/Thr protein kinase RdoA (MazF antagonist)